MLTTLLVIEDEAQMRRSIVTALRLKGYHVLEAANGTEGLAQARLHRPTIILCDVSMPGMNGHGVLSSLRSDPATAAAPFIFLTARGSAEDIRTGMNLGADDYLPKPFTVQELLCAIETRLRRVRELQSITQPVFDSAKPLERLGLTPREAEVMLWLAQGKGNAEIATILDTSVANIKKHAQHIFEKLGVENRSSAMLVAREALSAA
ncbi:MAG: response regulator [Prosthecobacter sp.]|uniref:response regulator n=1 Tax=Prosthecobacter sp. TaxID=1965333 RepID=UPI0039040D0D